MQQTKWGVVLIPPTHLPLGGPCVWALGNGGWVNELGLTATLMIELLLSIPQQLA